MISRAGKDFASAMIAFNNKQFPKALSLFQSVVTALNSINLKIARPIEQLIAHYYMLDSSLARIKCINDQVTVEDVKYDYPYFDTALGLINLHRSTNSKETETPFYLESETSMLLGRAKTAQDSEKFDDVPAYLKRVEENLLLMRFLNLSPAKIKNSQEYLDKFLARLAVIQFKSTVKCNVTIADDDCVARAMYNVCDLVDKISDQVLAIRVANELLGLSLEKEWKYHTIAVSACILRATKQKELQSTKPEEKKLAKELFDDMAKEFKPEQIKFILKSGSRVIPIIEEKPRNLSEAVKQKNIQAIQAMHGENFQEKLDAMLLAITLSYVESYDVLVDKMGAAGRDALLAQLAAVKSKEIFHVFMMIEHRGKNSEGRYDFIKVVTDALFDLGTKLDFDKENIIVGGAKTQFVKLRQFVTGLWKKREDAEFAATFKADVLAFILSPLRAKVLDEFKKMPFMGEQIREFSHLCRSAKSKLESFVHQDDAFKNKAIDKPRAWITRCDRTINQSTSKAQRKINKILYDQYKKFKSLLNREEKVLKLSSEQLCSLLVDFSAYQLVADQLKTDIVAATTKLTANINTIDEAFARKIIEDEQRIEAEKQATKQREIDAICAQKKIEEEQLKAKQREAERQANLHAQTCYAEQKKSEQQTVKPKEMEHQVQVQAPTCYTEQTAQLEEKISPSQTAEEWLRTGRRSRRDSNVAIAPVNVAMLALFGGLYQPPTNVAKAKETETPAQQHSDSLFEFELFPQQVYRY